MPKSKHKGEFIYPVWPREDPDTVVPDVQTEVLKAFRSTHFGTDLLSVYHVTFHNKEMTRWTALVSTESMSGGTLYYEIYFDGSGSTFLSVSRPPSNTRIMGIESPFPKEVQR